MDVDSLRPGEDWVEAVEGGVTSCDVLLAIIGPTWVGAVDSDGGLRLSQELDRVRLEIEAALRNNKPVIPVLVEGATMPTADQLPDSLKPLLRRHAIRISHPTFESDLGALVRALRTIDRARQPKAEPGAAAGGCHGRGSDDRRTAGGARAATARAATRTADTDLRRTTAAGSAQPAGLSHGAGPARVPVPDSRLRLYAAGTAQRTVAAGAGPARAGRCRARRRGAYGIAAHRPLRRDSGGLANAVRHQHPTLSPLPATPTLTASTAVATMTPSPALVTPTPFVGDSTPHFWLTFRRLPSPQLLRCALHVAPSC